jgi:hypothetical protein
MREDRWRKGIPPAGSFLRVAVPKNHSPYQSIISSWSGSTDWATYNGQIVLRVGPPRREPAVIGPLGRRSRNPMAFAVSAVPLAQRYLDLFRRFARAPKLAGPRKALLSAIVTAAGTFDLGRLSKPATFALAINLGVDLREGQLEPSRSSHQTCRSTRPTPISAGS